MSLLSDLVDAVTAGSIEVVDLTAPLSGDTWRFAFEEISRYDERGPAWYWNNFRSGEHTGTHFDAPIHWVTGRDGEDVASVAPERLVGPAVVIDKSAEAADDPDYLLGVQDVR